MSIIKELDFVPPTDAGFAFAGPVLPDRYRWYHGTAACLSAHIEAFGFSQDHRILDAAERNLLMKYWHHLDSRREPLDCITQERVSFSFATDPRFALRYATNPQKARTLQLLANDLLKLVCSGVATAHPQELAALEQVRLRFAEIAIQPGVLYALDLTDEDIQHFAEKTNVAHTYWSIPPDRIRYKMLIPSEFVDQ